jgi:hypothetical protein
MTYFENADHTEFDRNNDDKTKIDGGSGVPCRICEAMFGRETLTFRYCAQCKRGFCEGVHGSYSQIGKAVGICVVCHLTNKW